MAIKVSSSELHRVVATAIVYRRGKYLLLKRSEKETAFRVSGRYRVEDYIPTIISMTAQIQFLVSGILP